MKTCLELFAGAGGLALGLEKAGFHTIGLLEIDNDACLTLSTNRPHWNVLCEDITQSSEEDLEKKFSIKKGDLSLLSGGYPCQAFSYAGSRKGLGDIRGTLFFHYAKFLEKLMPKMFLVENVRGLVSHDNGKTLKTMLDVFANIGYKIQYRILNAWDYGVAQKRERIAIVGIREDLCDRIVFTFPAPQAYKPVLRDALADVPISEGAKYPEKKKRVLDLVPPGGSWVNLPKEIAKAYLQGSYHLEGGRRGIARRISWDEPSLTLTCSPAQKQTERCHPDETRPFTYREYARIQSFPDDWVFMGSLHSKYKQIGNAVPVELAYSLAKSIYVALEDVEI